MKKNTVETSRLPNTIHTLPQQPVLAFFLNYLANGNKFITREVVVFCYFRSARILETFATQTSTSKIGRRQPQKKSSEFPHRAAIIALLLALLLALRQSTTLMIHGSLVLFPLGAGFVSFPFFRK